MTSDRPPQGLSVKTSRLHKILEEMREGALVAYSGGTDSALLAHEAGAVLGEKCLLMTADSPIMPREELERAKEFARRHGLRQEVLATKEMENPLFLSNQADRCYHCKGELFERMAAVAQAKGFRWILFGAITDDAGDWRPGMRAAFERGVRAPLMEAGFSKEDVRERSRQLGLETWDKPSSACLASRIPFGRPITLEGLSKVERAEKLLHELGFWQCRVRLLDEAARIEVEAGELGRLLSEEIRSTVVKEFKGLGFRFVTLDLEGFRSGSMNPSPEGG